MRRFGTCVTATASARLKVRGQGRSLVQRRAELWRCAFAKLRRKGRALLDFCSPAAGFSTGESDRCTRAEKDHPHLAGVSLKVSGISSPGSHCINRLGTPSWKARGVCPDLPLTALSPFVSRCLCGWQRRGERLKACTLLLSGIIGGRCGPLGLDRFLEAASP
eukprot:6185695-Pleurochrysis_carterae.AAC.4